jgi:hypothetical protein
VVCVELWCAPLMKRGSGISCWTWVKRGKIDRKEENGPSHPPATNTEEQVNFHAIVLKFYPVLTVKPTAVRSAVAASSIHMGQCTVSTNSSQCIEHCCTNMTPYLDVTTWIRDKLRHHWIVKARNTFQFSLDKSYVQCIHHAICVVWGHLLRCTPCSPVEDYWHFRKNVIPLS